MLTLRQPRLRADHPVTSDYGVCGSAPHDPAGLSASLRNLAFETHRVVRALDGADRSAERFEDLVDLSERLELLYRKLTSEGLESLARYVAALQRTIAKRLI